MAVDGASPFVQNIFTDQPGIGYPGQVYKPGYHSQSFTETFAAGNGPVFCGRMVVVGTAIDHTNNDTLYSSPYTIKLLDAATVAADLTVGVVVRPLSGAQNEVDVEDGKEKAGFGAKDKIPVLRLGSKATIIVRQEGAVAYGDPVYVAKSSTNDANINVGEFTKASGTGLLLVPNAIWYLTKTATETVVELTTYALDAVGVIQLL